MDNAIYRQFNLTPLFNHMSLTVDEFEELKGYGASKEQIDKVLDDLEVFPGTKDFENLYVTARLWLNHRHPELFSEKMMEKENSKLKDSQR